MTIVRRTGFGDLLSLRQAMDRLFEESFVNPRTWQFGDGQLVPVDVYQTVDTVFIEAVLPGVKPEEVEITVEGNTLSISGDTSSMIPAREGLLLQEIRRGRFVRTLNLPEGLEPDKAAATFEDGILTLRIPKAVVIKARQIKIQTEPARSATGNGHNAEPVPVEK
ncbi:MAG TPA: Hsp20/alpha crystallin family protein [Candidatus Limnocylindrales bacterium]|jgi:HSP20 family protein